MFRFAALSLIALGLASCGQQEPSIEGKWAWFNETNCEADRDTIEFSGISFVHRREGNIYVRGNDLAFQRTTEDGVARVTAIYRVDIENTNEGRIITLTFEPAGNRVLVFRGSTINGEAPEAAGRAMGRVLFRCE